MKDIIEPNDYCVSAQVLKLNNILTGGTLYLFFF